MRPISRIALLLFFLLVPAGVAHAGGWASVAVDRLPDDTSAGVPVNVKMKVLQHGVTPLDGLVPSVRIENDEGVVQTFKAKPTGEPGGYVAAVTFPSDGRWRWRIFDGFTDAVPHIPPPVDIGPATGAVAIPLGTAVPDENTFPWPQTIAIGLLVLLFAAGWFVLTGSVRPRERRAARRGRRPAPGTMA